MTLEHNGADCAPEPGAQKIGAKLTPPLVRDAEFLRSIGYTNTRIVHEGVAVIALRERKVRGVRA